MGTWTPTRRYILSLGKHGMYAGLLLLPYAAAWYVHGKHFEGTEGHHFGACVLGGSCMLRTAVLGSADMTPWKESKQMHHINGRNERGSSSP